MSDIPNTQCAVQLVGPEKLRLNAAKQVHAPGPRQVLAKIEAVGLCFSDLKLLKQFTEHPRKAEVVAGLSRGVLSEIPSYVPGDAPTVPGHEAVAVIVAVGTDVKHHRLGERVLIQTDYRDLKTAGSNAAFGYNFEGALQEYVLMDERVIIEQGSGQRFLIPAPDRLSASAIALVEPWACVEDSYVTQERRTIKRGGKLLVVAEQGHRIAGLAELMGENPPASVTALCADASQRKQIASPSRQAINVETSELNAIATLPDAAFDDIVYFGASKARLDVLNNKLAARGIINVVLGGNRIGKPVSVGVGRVHYGMTRWIGAAGDDARESYNVIPDTGEIRSGDSVCIVGAGGPMGQMHVIRAVFCGMPCVTVVGTDVDAARLASLEAKAGPIAKSRRIPLELLDTSKKPSAESFSYIAIMVPVGAFVADAVAHSAPGCLINVFAGIPAPTRQDLDMDRYIANRCFMFGTSGSTIRDMQIVLEKVAAGRLDTNVSVDAVSGMAGAIDGISAVANRTLAGKIIVYPQLHDLPLTPLSELPARLPAVAAKLEHGMWTKAAEAELLAQAK